MAEIPEKSKRLLASWAALKSGRLTREARWQEVADYCDISEDMVDVNGMTIALGGPSTVRKVYTGAGILNAKRCAALLVGYTVNPVRPFQLANMEMPADMSAGFLTQNSVDPASKAYFEGLNWMNFYEQMRPKSGFMTSTALAMRDFVNYGPGIKFLKLADNGEARYRHCSVKNCWIRVNDDGEVDTLYRRAYYWLDRLLALWPEAETVDKIRKAKEAFEKNRGANILVQVINGVEPRAGGVSGGRNLAKPFASYFFLPDHDGFIMEEDGFDSFPYSVARNDATENNPYGVGLAEAALADLKALNHYIAGVENNLDLTNEPPALYLEGLFDKFSFDAGALTPVDPFATGMMNLTEAYRPLAVAGQVAPAMNYIDRLELRIGEFFFTDWMKLRESGSMTATEVNERRDLRLRSMSALVPGLDRDMFGAEADRVMELKIRKKLLPPFPPALRGRSISWDYAGPLANAMRANQADVKGKLFTLWQGLIENTPEIADIIDIEAVLRSWADDLGIEPGNLRSADDVKQRSAERQAKAAQEQQMQAMQAGATSFRDGAQGIASLANAGNGNAVEMANQMAA